MLANMRATRTAAAFATIAALLVVAAPADAAPACRGTVNADELSQMAPQQTKHHVRTVAGACGRRIWIHDGRQQRRYWADDGRELRINYNIQPDGRWLAVNGFWMTPNGAGDLVFGQ
jgi:hypothetical protein